MRVKGRRPLSCFLDWKRCFHLTLSGGRNLASSSLSLPLVFICLHLYCCFSKGGWVVFNFLVRLRLRLSSQSASSPLPPSPLCSRDASILLILLLRRRFVSVAVGLQEPARLRHGSEVSQRRGVPGSAGRPEEAEGRLRGAGGRRRRGRPGRSAAHRRYRCAAACSRAFGLDRRISLLESSLITAKIKMATQRSARDELPDRWRIDSRSVASLLPVTGSLFLGTVASLLL